MSGVKQGIVYVLTNLAMPGLVKIGQTGNEIGNRLRELNTMGVPFQPTRYWTYEGRSLNEYYNETYTFVD